MAIKIPSYFNQKLSQGVIDSVTILNGGQVNPKPYEGQPSNQEEALSILDSNIKLLCTTQDRESLAKDLIANAIAIPSHEHSLSLIDFQKHVRPELEGQSLTIPLKTLRNLFVTFAVLNTVKNSLSDRANHLLKNSRAVIKDVFRRAKILVQSNNHLFDHFMGITRKLADGHINPESSPGVSIGLEHVLSGSERLRYLYGPKGNCN